MAQFRSYTNFIVLSAGTAPADGVYQWSTTSTSSTIPGNDWAAGTVRVSPDGALLSWQLTDSYTQFALNATAIPEPSLSWLLLLGSGVFLYARHNKKPFHFLTSGVLIHGRRRRKGLGWACKQPSSVSMCLIQPSARN